MRANGWSLGSISRELGVPKSTLFNWESDPAIHRSINVIKSLQLEKLQEKYIPSFEEELQRLSTCLCRIERALEKQDFEAMRPEFLLRTSLQLRSRLNKLRSEIQPTRTMDTGELPPNPLPGCISRSRTEIVEDGQPEFGVPAPAGESGFGVPASAGRGSNLPKSVNGDADVLHPKWDENENSSEPKPSAPATSNEGFGTIVPNSQSADSSPSPPPPEERAGDRRPDSRHSSSSSNPTTDPCTPSRVPERYGDLATPLTNIPVHVDADQIALTAGLDSSCVPGATTRPCAPSRPITPPPHKPCAADRAQLSNST